eukprot:TRINITY_DN15453_c0_g1::TRINITY_DN15453_c0_g1_i1::g.30490::m.30490 TRINITY_DN15453_c0_g1::TRINITY_DN15453_c0_g1_i1::g.30490  ORF type:complete len:308 (+),score=34.46,sp/Q8NFH5/NUP53_HUMAN/34.31/6e-19,Nup35_RRM/PF05172.8/8.3e-18,Nup35_RRM_2/PF14605.1/3.3e-15,Hepar_II_III/PF07940.8/0.05,DUF4283/PF14111.1/0.14 TRINITY_DN15453_c0_g1_i1:49-972(+)
MMPTPYSGSYQGSSFLLPEARDLTYSTPAHNKIGLAQQSQQRMPTSYQQYDASRDQLGSPSGYNPVGSPQYPASFMGPYGGHSFSAATPSMSMSMPMSMSMGSQPQSASRSAAPPTVSLMSSAGELGDGGSILSPFKSQVPPSPMTPGTSMYGTDRGFASPSRPSAPPTTTMMNVNEDSGENWVTVFGFPPELASGVLRMMQECGPVVRHRMGNGNWMHLQYETSLHAQKALSRNGKLIMNDSIMIGVIPFSDSMMNSVPRKATLREAPIFKKQVQAKPYDVEVTETTAAQANKSLLTRINDFLFTA